MFYNRIQVAGYLADKPALRLLPSGTPVANARLAQTKKFKNSEGREQEQTTWFPLSFKDKRAEFAAAAFEKGDHLFVEGEFRERTWKDDSGRERSTWELFVQHVHAIPRRGTTTSDEEPETRETTEAGDDGWPV